MIVGRGCADTLGNIVYRYSEGNCQGNFRFGYGTNGDSHAFGEVVQKDTHEEINRGAFKVATLLL